MLDKNTIEQAKRVDIIKVLAFYGVYGNRDGLYHCPNPSHTDTHRSASINRKDNKIYCFSCNPGQAVGYDTVDIVMFQEGLKFRDAVRKVLLIDGQNVDILVDKEVSYQKNFDFTDSSAQYEWFVGRIKEIEELDKYSNKDGMYTELKALRNDIYNNLTERCLDYKKLIPILKSNGITINGNYYRDKSTGELITSIVYNIRQGEKFCIQKGFKLNEYGKKMKKNYGTPHPIGIKVNNEKVIYITEGLEDAMCFVQANRNAISLNSTSNLNKFINSLETGRYDEYEFVIALDKDSTGIEASNMLKLALNNRNIKFTDYMPLLNCKNENIKDVNEYWIYINKNKKK